jgi:hypothetical protein
MNNKRTLTDEQVHEICQLLMNGEKRCDISEQYNVHDTIISNIKYKKSYRDIVNIYNLEETWKPRARTSKLYSDKFIDFILECIKNNTPINEILSDERCEISDKDILSNYISKIRTGRLYRNRLIKNKMYHDNINNPINNNIISDETVISIANDIKSNSNISNKELANKYNQTDIIISNIRNGKSHLNITGIKEGQYALINNKEIIISIANDIKTNPNISNKELVNKYNLSSVTISNIRNGKIHSDITGIKKGQYNLKCIIDNSTIESIIKDIKENPKMLLIDICKKYRVSRSYVYTIKTKIIKGIE